MNKKLALLTLVSASVLTLGIGFAHAGDGHGRGHGDPGARMCEKLECTAKQKTEITNAIKELRADLEPEREAISKVRDQVATEWAKDKPDEKKLQSLYATIAKHQAAMRDRVHDAFMEIHPVLTPKQREKAAKALSHKFANMGGGKGGHGDHGDRGNRGNRGADK